MRIVFVTGTDTGVGKTLLTALLLIHLRRRGCHALAVKPFCSGGLQDARILRRAQGKELSLPEISPFSFQAPLAPLAAARREHRAVTLPAAVDHVRKIASRCELLLVEGAGGLLVPLGESFTVADFIEALDCAHVVVVAANRLGAINQSLLTLEALQARGIARPSLVVMDRARKTVAGEGNVQLISEFSDANEVCRVAFLGSGAARTEALEQHEKKLKKTLARLVPKGIVSSASSAACRKRKKLASGRSGH